LGESKVKFCPNCGAELPFQQAKFCSECGFSLVGYAAEEIVPKKSYDSQAQTTEELVISISELARMPVPKMAKKGFKSVLHKLSYGLV
jgi:hypothetical protein